MDWRYLLVALEWMAPYSDFVSSAERLGQLPCRVYTATVLSSTRISTVSLEKWLGWGAV